MAEQNESNTLQVPSSGVGGFQPPKMEKYKPDTSKANWKSQQYMPGIATEVETEWNEKLYEKFKAIDNQKALIQTTINNLDKDYVSQKQKLNDSFTKMISLLETRRDYLLNTMNENVIKYRKDLNSQLPQLISDRKQLKECKNQYENNVNNKDLTDIEERETTNIKIISDALNNCQIKTKLKPKHPSYIIDQKSINNSINNFGEFILKTDIPESPIVSVLVRTSENALIEILMDEKYNDDVVMKYELNIYKGALDEKEWINVKDNEYLKINIKSQIRQNNICFYKIDDLDDNEDYNIRTRAMFGKDDDNIIGKYSNWLSFKTKQLGSDDDDDNKDMIAYTHEDEAKLEQAWNNNMEQGINKEINDFDSWLLIFKRLKLGISKYKQMRIFFCMQQVEQGAGSKIDAGDFANFVLSVGQRFDAKEWRNMCKRIYNDVIKK